MVHRPPEIRTALIAELQRQAEDQEDLKVIVEGTTLIVHGPVDLGALVVAIEGAIAGGS